MRGDQGEVVEPPVAHGGGERGAPAGPEGRDHDVALQHDPGGSRSASRSAGRKAVVQLAARATAGRAEDVALQPPEDPLDRPSDALSGRSNRTRVNTSAEQHEEQQRATPGDDGEVAGTGAVRIEPASATIGSANSTPFETIDVAASAAPAVARFTPETDSIR